MWLLIFNLWHKKGKKQKNKTKKKGDIKQQIHLQKRLKAKQMIVIIKIIKLIIIVILVLLIIIIVTIVIIKQKVNSL